VKRYRNGSMSEEQIAEVFGYATRAVRAGAVDDASA
jgi:hypothetical protein